LSVGTPAPFEAAMLMVTGLSVFPSNVMVVVLVTYFRFEPTAFA
jgi:hypothetical protein